MKDQYYFGTLARQIDYFAFPRTGSHYFNYCTVGLFDRVALPTPGLGNQEAISRQAELDPDILYALDLREDGVPYQPVFINQRATGQHGDPAAGDHPVVLIIREPMATVYSYYRASVERWGLGDRIRDRAAWVQEKLVRYRQFYAKGFALLEARPHTSLLIRYEDLVASPEPLERLVKFVGVRPKLRPSLVHRLTRFETIAAAGSRTFYRAGDNEAWRRDPEWTEVLGSVEVPDLSGFGYAPTATTPAGASATRM